MVDIEQGVCIMPGCAPACGRAAMGMLLLLLVMGVATTSGEFQVSAVCVGPRIHVYILWQSKT